MTIQVIGLGLIGGSLCKAIKKNTTHRCLGYDTNQDSVNMALAQGAMDAPLMLEQLSEAEMTVVCLPPSVTVRFVKESAAKFLQGSTVLDCCGVKEIIVNELTAVLAEHGVHFVGGHPMAGREFSGFSSALDTLFDRASFIITPIEQTDEDAVKIVTSLVQQIGFAAPVYATPTQHDKIIAFTSQLAHIVSNAYVKSPTAALHVGFSAGSFRDLTRVAKLNAPLWTNLMMQNRKHLLEELTTLQHHLEEYREALEQDDDKQLERLLQVGTYIKENMT